MDIALKYNTLGITTLGDYNNLILSEEVSTAAHMVDSASTRYVTGNGTGRGANNLAVEIQEFQATDTSINVRFRDLNLQGSNKLL